MLQVPVGVFVMQVSADGEEVWAAPELALAHGMILSLLSCEHV